MKISVGLLYSTQYFLKLVEKYKIIPDSFIENNSLYLVSNPKSIIEISLTCNWITLENDIIRLTSYGKEIVNCPLPYKKLRIQLKHYILLMKPPWFLMMHYGRKEASSYFPLSVFQCFHEAHLLESVSSEVVEWWDELGSLSRNEKSDNNLERGRLGERLSYLFEKHRIGSSPHWQAIDSNFSGYDILSKIDKNNNTNLMIEVKTSIYKTHFYLTKNEWETAIESQTYIFHLWIIKPSLQLYVFNSEFLRPFIPVNTNKGVWDNCYITLNPNDLLYFKTKHNINLNEIKEQEI